jgi:hypothetical protein
MEERERIGMFTCCVCRRESRPFSRLLYELRDRLPATKWSICVMCQPWLELRPHRRGRYLATVRAVLLTSHTQRHGVLKRVPAELRLMIWAHLEEALFALPDYSPTWLSDVARLYE